MFTVLNRYFKKHNFNIHIWKSKYVEIYNQID